MTTQCIDPEEPVGSESMQALWDHSHIDAAHAPYLDALYTQFLQDPQSVPPRWQAYFLSLLDTKKGEAPGKASNDAQLSHAAVQDFLRAYAARPPVYWRKTQTQAGAPNRPACLPGEQGSAPLSAQADSGVALSRWVQAYREQGHLVAQTDPLQYGAEQAVGALPPVSLGCEAHGLPPAMPLSASLTAAMGLIGTDATVSALEQQLQQWYCGHIGFEYTHISDPAITRWLRDRIEYAPENAVTAAAAGKACHQHTATEKRRFFHKLMAAEVLEDFLGRKFPGQKRFSLQGGDSLIPLLDVLIDRMQGAGVNEVIIGMAHRGRLNVLFNIFGLSAAELCKEFEGKVDYGMTSGDVKYHMGFSSDIKTDHGKLHLALAFNPSHLEFISAVLMGSVRARQARCVDVEHRLVGGVMIHGDAAFTGQGVVMEILNMSQTQAYAIGGSVHVVVNNQIGFTTRPTDSRSSRYCTDFAKAIGAPIFHVNADDVEAVAYVAKLAADYRMRFRRDVVIDLVCYRLHGHNEADEPAATQPMMYRAVRQHPKPYTVYARQLVEQGILTGQAVKDAVAQCYQSMEAGHALVDILHDDLSEQRAQVWAPYLGQSWTAPAKTAVSLADLQRWGKKLVTYPAQWTLQRQVGRMMAARKEMVEGQRPMDWGCAELLAYASLLDQGYGVRLVGQDSRRGTFAHRHAALYDQNNNDMYVPLCHISENQANFEVYDSVLSEAGALGFEYGYATTDPGNLVIWEAQFGDFANGAQVIIDQFISSGCQKWRRLCGLVLLLPHGYEGMGPEHSSARLERFLQLCAQENMQVCIPSTPAQFFHMLRRQMLRFYRKPLVVMTPKLALRHKLAVSTQAALVEGKFQEIIRDDLPVKGIQRVVLCSGRVYYDLFPERQSRQCHRVALVRIEQLYPFPYEALSALLQEYAHVKEVVWCQEEPQNQGAWYAKKHCFTACLAPGQVLSYVGRDPFASPAAGYPLLHRKQQWGVIEAALCTE